MGEKKEYLWRPNDQSPATKLKFELEVSHWLSAIKNSTPAPTPSFSEVSGFIGLLLSFIFNLIHFIILIVIDVVKWVIKIWPKKTPKDKYDGVPTFRNKPKLSYEEMCQIQRDAEDSGVRITVE